MVRAKIYKLSKKSDISIREFNVKIESFRPLPMFYGLNFIIIDKMTLYPISVPDYS